MNQKLPFPDHTQEGPVMHSWYSFSSPWNEERQTPESLTNPPCRTQGYVLRMTSSGSGSHLQLAWPQVHSPHSLGFCQHRLLRPAFSSLNTQGSLPPEGLCPRVPTAWNALPPQALQPLPSFLLLSLITLPQEGLAAPTGQLCFLHTLHITCTSRSSYQSC